MSRPEQSRAASDRLELWAGVEPTVSRVGDETMDQLVLGGFHERLDDLDRLASLGITALRFPLLWERTAPDGLEQAQWSWAETRLKRLEELGVEPILGLVHHGSGPFSTHLLDPGFPAGVAAYARAVAERYPHLTAYTPINEPLTTARFSALYGHWYPHARDERSFWKALMHQLQATVLAMREIRAVNPAARLIQTEDLGRVSATPELQHQADFENERRWLTYDLLLGRVDHTHPVWSYLLWAGATEEEVGWFAENPCPPDLLGLNVYVTSERFLDGHVHRYPPHTHGGNGRQRYADVEAVRARGDFIGGAETRLREAHARYGLPMAITEVHLGCTREEQLRWLLETWRGAERVRKEGADVRAITTWAAFGAYEWNSLLTRRQGHYESGLWDVRAPQAQIHPGQPVTPRPTALATLARELATGQTPSHPVLAGPGWWRRSERLLFTPYGPVQAETPVGRPLLITGKTGTLGMAMAHACELRGLPYRLLSRQELDITDPGAVARALEQHDPWAVVNTAGYVRVDEAEDDPRNGHENMDGPRLLAQACAETGVRLVTFSSDLVFDGTLGRPYVESDAPHPLNAYGRSKLAAEREVLSRMPEALVIRTSAFFGPWDPHNFAAFVRRELLADRRVRVAADQVVSPTYVPDLTRGVLELLIDGESGVWHLANDGAVSWADFARQVAQVLDLDPGLVEAVPGAELGQRAARPAYSVLSSERGALMPTFVSALLHWSHHAHVPDEEELAAD
ncbi:dTDP-4-dehydrorhamnose reductase [Deinococcus hopiensis]|uniref:dTDP-4-dehydrorhamnose reductase n=1 Tax=Deinococcus hopiensis KR-140 TaxID=695939 RepID=A0A1W1V8K1_9DEIO|nr:dTDP-4-dehydrorhamnose reductase [Deinococcus hopiensis]SMB89361.1 dTDP-4-dehydrorhamnose reductase [Deinococcus hopiensis KR-140]